ncbi:hypothetical protein BHM03_00004987 [Ensete ventricosum]|uniref:Uncharacterized protein n=1 Tax=Ensete ventricosum TaxID=4639 RepID=A0A445MAZ4_ENSVE|nr:hypothetical protein BHM03_00004987 [Ensete ventricosum]
MRAEMWRPERASDSMSICHMDLDVVETAPVPHTSDPLRRHVSRHNDRCLLPVPFRIRRRRTRGGRRFAVTLDADGWDLLERADPTAERARLRRFVASIKGSTTAAKKRVREGERERESARGEERSRSDWSSLSFYCCFGS